MTPDRLSDAAASAGWTSAGVTFTLWGLRVSDMATLITAAVAVFGLGLQIWFKVREDRRAQRLFEEEIRRLRDQGGPPSESSL